MSTLLLQRCISFDSYIKPQPVLDFAHIGIGCISFDSYIKPQLTWCFCQRSWVVYLLIPTSNHNTPSLLNFFSWLYIFWFLHQTTTAAPIIGPVVCCISFDSYIKPQLTQERQRLVACCISFDSYIKPQPAALQLGYAICCISFDSYIKPQHIVCSLAYLHVVYLLIPTSNHNYKAKKAKEEKVVYLLIPTSNHNLQSLPSALPSVVYLLIPTSNHNINEVQVLNLMLYIFWFLHQTTTSSL